MIFGPGNMQFSRRIERGGASSCMTSTPSGASVRSASPRHPANHLCMVGRCSTAQQPVLMTCVREFLSDRALGGVRIGGSEALIAVYGFAARTPGVTVHTRHLISLADQYRVLRERRVDLVLGRLASTVENDIETQTLYHDRIFVVAGLHSRWIIRRKIDLTELANEPW